MTRATGQLTPALLQSAVASLQSLIDCDQPEDRDDFGFSPRYDHGAIESVIEQYEALKQDPKWNTHHGLKVPLLGYLFQYAVNGHDERAARNLEYEIERLMTSYLWVKGEPETPDFFSSNGLNM